MELGCLRIELINQDVIFLEHGPGKIALIVHPSCPCGRDQLLDKLGVYLFHGREQLFLGVFSLCLFLFLASQRGSQHFDHILSEALYANNNGEITVTDKLSEAFVAVLDEN